MKLRNPEGIFAYTKNFAKDVREAIRFGLPSELGSNVSNFAGQNYIVIVLGIMTTVKIVGYFQAASALASIITVITASLSLSLFAAFSSLYGKQGNTSLGFVYVVKYISLWRHSR